jgi:hypothetical protein
MSNYNTNFDDLNKQLQPLFDTVAHDSADKFTYKEIKLYPTKRGDAQNSLLEDVFGEYSADYALTALGMSQTSFEVDVSEVECSGEGARDCLLENPSLLRIHLDFTSDDDNIL